MAGIDYFLDIDGIEGESTDERHAGEIDVTAFQWGVAHTGGSGAGGAAGTGKADPDEFLVLKQVDRSSPRLLVACAAGQRFSTAVLSARKGGSRQDFLTYTLRDVGISRYDTEGDDADELPLIDEIGLRFAVIEISYRPQRPDGSLGTAVVAGYDFRRNRVI